MRTQTCLVSLLLLTALLLFAGAACGAPPTSSSESGSSDLNELARLALLGDTEATDAETALRAKGQAGVDALFAARPDTATGVATWEQALDRVCAQRYCRHSRLFWHTDFESAVAEAEGSDRPILSLRLLGRLDEDRSCANSRFFRTVLYADPAVARDLRERFVLHWSSERPVPKLTIDYGDGRQIEGTITGNSVHYVLDSHGRLVDALPGLYGPGLFRQRIGELGDLATKLSDADGPSFLDARGKHHVFRLAVAGSIPAGGGQIRPASRLGAVEASRLAQSKTMTEIKVVEAATDGPQEILMPETLWALLALERPQDWKLSRPSRELLRSTHAGYVQSVGGFSGLDEADTARRALEAFEQTVGVDTMRNEYDLHPKIHQRLAEATDPAIDAEPGIERFNRWVYDEIFLTPASDPWLGLWSPEVIAALAPSDRD